MLRRELPFWLPVLLLFAVACTTAGRWDEWFTGLAGLLGHEAPRQWALHGFRGMVRYSVALRGALFLGALAALVALQLRPTLSRLRRQVDRSELREAALVLLLLLPLALPLGVGADGIQYAEYSLAPFAQPEGPAYRRLLPVAAAHALQLDGPLYLLPSLAVTGALLLLARLFLRAQGLLLRRWEWVSLGSCSFVLFQLHLPGYPEQWVYLLLLASLLADGRGPGRAALTALMLISHESAALFGLLPLLVLHYPRTQTPRIVAVIALFFAMWLVQFGFDLKVALATHTVVDHTDPITVLLKGPVHLLWGVLLTHKALWAVGASAVVRGLRRPSGRRRAALVAAALLLPFFQLLLAVDISRLITFGFVGILFALAQDLPRFCPRARAALFGLNLALPTIFYGPYPLTLTPPGVYRVFDLLRG